MNLNRALDVPTPAAPDLASGSDSGISGADNITRLDNRSPLQALTFTVSNVLPGANVTLLADGSTVLGAAVAIGPSVSITTTGLLELGDGLHAITAVQSELGGAPSPQSPPLSLVVDSTSPVIGTLIDSPDPAPVGGVFVLTAGQTSDATGITSIGFFRESNGLVGLQTGTGGDAHVGTDTDSGDGWSISASTSGLMLGTYTYYALATDFAGNPGSTGTSAILTTHRVASSVQIVDDGNAGWSSNAPWPTSGLLGYGGDSRHNALITTRTATWTFAVMPGATYRVATTWPVHANSTTTARFAVLDDGTQIGSRTLNQRTAPNDFNDLGVGWENLGGQYIVTSSVLQIRLTSSGTTGYVRADAVRLEMVASPAAPEIGVFHESTSIPDDTGSVAFGATPIGVPLDKTFSIQNTGTGVLTLGAITLPSGFSLVAGPGISSLAAGASTSFTVRFDASASGTSSGTLAIATNDADENPFNFTISGMVLEPARIVDDGDLGWSSNAAWSVSGLGGNSQDSRHNGLSLDLTSTWSFTVIPGATYRVSVTWPAHSNSSPAAPYIVLDNGVVIGSQSFNQQQPPDDLFASGRYWEDIGVPYTVSSSLLQIHLSTTGTTGYVRADAVRIEQVIPGQGFGLGDDFGVSGRTEGQSTARGALGMRASSRTLLWLSGPVESEEQVWIPPSPQTVRLRPRQRQS
jgi:hypothetical protein